MALPGNLLDSTRNYNPGLNSTSYTTPLPGGGGGGNLGVANYGGLTPTIAGTDGAYTIDSSTGQIFWFFNGIWQ